MQKTKVDISTQNFDYYFANGVKDLSVKDKSEIPRDFVFSLFRSSGVLKPDSFHKVNFLERTFILWKVIKKRFFIVFEDEKKGMSTGEFIQFKKALKEKDYGQEQVGILKSTGTFILADKDLCDTFAYGNRLSNSPAYNYLNKVKVLSPNKVDQFNDELAYMNKFISHYEANRKKLVVSAGFEMGEWLVLTYLYHGEPMPSSPIYKEVYRYSYNSSAKKVKQAFSVLQQKGYIEKIGVSKGTNLRITPLGRQLVNELMIKFVAI